MKLSQLMKRVKTNSIYADCEISFVTDNFEKIEENCLFVCINGHKTDAHIFADKAIERGAAAVVVERDVNTDKQIIVEDTREAYALLCSAYYGNPAEKIKIIGITGTNGKTSTSFLLNELIKKAGYKTGLIGTVVDIIDDKEIDSTLTTPDSADLFRYLSDMVECGCEYCIMETSSQALDQKRLSGIQFEAGVFTNLTTDHLDYHKTMEEYFKAKRTLFANCKKAIINLDDENGLKICEGIDLETVTYSIKDDHADYTAKNVEYYDDSVKYELVGMGVIGRVKLHIPGKFSVYNSMAAAVTAIELGIDMPKITETLSQTKGVKGRMETVEINKDFTVIIDYAHTPDGLENLLSSLRRVYNGRIITVFGCGGDRDITKRPEMGRIAGNNSDITIVTSDNPRSENPEEIINDILEGMTDVKSKKYTICDRTEAIKKALSLARSGDVVVLAGKGHETYQILSSGKIHYDEREIINEILKNKR